MKINIFLSSISIVLACLFGILAFNIAEGNENDTICGVGSGVCFVTTLIPMMGLQYESTRQGTNIRILSSVFFVIFLISHFCFAIFGVKMPFYIISNGILLIIYLAIYYKIQGITKL